MWPVAFKILVTGSRTLTQEHAPLVYQALNNLAGDKLPVLIIHGNANGADAIADAWAVECMYALPVRVPADWNNYGARAGTSRNEMMLELKPDHVLAFPVQGLPNKGTNHMIAIAHKAEVPVTVVEVH